ncbi:MAG: TetR family transcriptional regulator [Acidimicrobiales bacterium]
MAIEATTTLTKSQAARRQRVVAAALSLGAHGGYDAVQMREVAAEAGVALGTIYRYFSSKDHLLAEAQVEWLLDLDRRVSKRPPKGDSLADRVIDVLRRATRAMEQEPKLAEALVVALTSTDPEASRCQRETGEIISRTMATAFEAGFDHRVQEDIIRVLGHVWFSSLIGWVNRWYGFDHVGEEVELAAHLLLDQYD